MVKPSDNKIKQKLDQHEIIPSEGVWSAICGELDNPSIAVNKGAKKRRLILIRMAAAIVIVLSISFVFLLNDADQPNAEKTLAAVTNPDGNSSSSSSFINDPSTTSAVEFLQSNDKSINKSTSAQIAGHTNEPFIGDDNLQAPQALQPSQPEVVTQEHSNNWSAVAALIENKVHLTNSAKYVPFEVQEDHVALNDNKEFTATDVLAFSGSNELTDGVEMDKIATQIFKAKPSPHYRGFVLSPILSQKTSNIKRLAATHRAGVSNMENPNGESFQSASYGLQLGYNFSNHLGLEIGTQFGKEGSNFNISMPSELGEVQETPSLAISYLRVPLVVKLRPDHTHLGRNPVAINYLLGIQYGHQLSVEKSAMLDFVDLEQLAKHEFGIVAGMEYDYFISDKYHVTLSGRASVNTGFLNNTDLQLNQQPFNYGIEIGAKINYNFGRIVKI